MRRVILESPYAGNVKQNEEYARTCMRESLLMGESPIASHLLYTQPGVLRDDVLIERDLGIAAGLAWRPVAELSIFWTDLGWSRGMLAAFDSAIAEGRPYTMRSLHGRPIEPLRGSGGRFA
jgi:hypothetical protein